MSYHCAKAVLLLSIAVKKLAMKLIQFLSEPVEDSLLSDIAMNTLHANGVQDTKMINSERLSIILHEMKRSAPASLYMLEDHEDQFVYTFYTRSPYTGILNGSNARSVLERFAAKLDSDFMIYNQDPRAYDACYQKLLRSECLSSL